MHRIDICRVLHIDLSSRKTYIETFGREDMEKYLGGRGIASLLLYRDVKKGCDPLGAENIIVFAPGVIDGTNAPTAGRTTIVSKSPATGLFCKTNMGGHFGAELKFAGYDLLCLHGKSEEWLSIIVTNDGVSFESGDPYLGMSIRDLTQKIMDDHPSLPDLSVCCIGTAGENNVAYAGIFCSTYHTSARCGIGAVMGSKHVKAVSVYGNDGLQMADMGRFLELTQKSRDVISSIARCKFYKDFGTAGGVPGINNSRTLPTRNFTSGYMEDAYAVSGQAVMENGHFLRYESCYGCTISCKRYSKTVNKYPGSESGGPEYENISVYGAGCGVSDLDAVLRANDLSNQYGLDVISAGACIQWAMESAERGVLPKTFIDPLTGKEYRLGFGEAEAMLILLEMITYRRGLGDLLANGVRKAAEAAGGDSWKWAVEAKGLEQSRVETRNAKGYALSFATNLRGPDHLYGQCMAEFGSSPEMKAIIKRITGDEKYANQYITDKRADIVEWHENAFAMTDILGFCSRATLSTYAILPEDMAAMYEAATGIEMDEAKITLASKRVINIEKSFNVREGARRSLDVLPWRLMNEPMEAPDGTLAVNSKEELDLMLSDYYQFRGWDENGVPTIETIRELGIEDVVKTEDYL